MTTAPKPPGIPGSAMFKTMQTELAKIDEMVGDAVSQLAGWKGSVEAATTVDITLSGLQTIDGIVVTAGELVLVKNQTDASENGIYVCSVVDWYRSNNMVDGSDAAGAAVYVTKGTVNENIVFICTNDIGAGIVGSNDLVFTELISAVTTMQQFVGLESVLSFSAGTWTTFRIARGNYVSRHTITDETTIIGIDINPAIRIATSKGFMLNSFDVIYGINAGTLDAHTITLDRIVYANNVAVSITAIPVTGTLATATQANPYVTNIVVTTPAYLVTADSKYIIELTVNNSASSEYDYYGIMLRFSKTST